MVEAGAVDEDHGRLRRGALVGGGVGKYAPAVDLEIHFAETFRARSRSSMRSCASSSPIDRRTVPAVMPAFTRSASILRYGAVGAGGTTSDQASATCAR